MSESLDDALIAAHTVGDSYGLVALYLEAAKGTADPDRVAFYLTHAHIFALETGHPDAARLRDILVAQGREAPLLPPIAPKR